MALSINYNLVSSGEFQANTYEFDNQQAPDVLGLSNGGSVVASIPTDRHPLMLDFYDANGQIVADSVTAYDSPNITVGQPSLTELANGNVLVVWDDEAATGVGLKGRLFTADGDPIGQEIFLTGFDDLLGVQDPQVTALTGGGFVVTYDYETFNFDGGVYCCVYDDAGVAQTSIDTLVASTAPGQNDSTVTALAEGGFVVTWTDSASSSDQIYGRIFNEDGSPRTDEFPISSGIGDHTNSSVTGLPNGNFAVVYTDGGWGNESGSTGITMHIFDAEGNDVTPGIGIIHVNTPGIKNESDPDITVLPDGLIVVTWTREGSAGSANPDIVGRIFDQNGNPITVNGDAGEFYINGGAGHLDDNVLSAVSSILGGQFVTAWQDEITDGNGGQITSSVSEIVRIVNGDGADDTFNGDELVDIVNGYSGNE